MYTCAHMCIYGMRTHAHARAHMRMQHAQLLQLINYKVQLIRTAPTRARVHANVQWSTRKASAEAARAMECACSCTRMRVPGWPWKKTVTDHELCTHSIVINCSSSSLTGGGGV